MLAKNCCFKLEYLYILSVLIGVHLSLQKYPLVRVSFILLVIIMFKILFALCKNKKKYKINISEFSIGLIMMICSIFPYLIKPGTRISRAFDYNFYIIQGFFICFLIYNEDGLNNIIKLIKVFWYINVIIGIIEIITGNHLQLSDPSRYMLSATRIPLGVFFNQNDFGVYIVLMIPFFVINLFKQKNIFQINAVILNIMLIIATGSRGAVLSGIVSLVFSSMYIFKKGKINLKIKSILTIGLSILITFAVINYLLSINILEGQYIKGKIGDFKFIDYKNFGRIILYKNYIEIFKNNILGVGGGQAQNYNEMLFRDLNNPHSLVIEIAVNFGIIGLILFIVYYITLIYKCVKCYIISRKKRDNIYEKLSYILFINLISFIIGSNVPSRVLNGFDILWVLLGLIHLNEKLIRDKT